VDGTVHTVPNGQIIVASNLSRGRHPASTGFGTARPGATETPEEPRGK
jgi:hypothetical protein